MPTDLEPGLFKLAWRKNRKVTVRGSCKTT
jgi:hypothetical protein